MGKIVRNGVEFAGSSNSAENIKYDDTTSMKDAIDETKTDINTLNSNLSIKGESVILVYYASNTTPTNITIEDINNFEFIVVLLESPGAGVFASGILPVSLFKQITTNGTPFRVPYTDSAGKFNYARIFYVDDTTMSVDSSTGFRVLVYGIRK